MPYFVILPAINLDQLPIKLDAEYRARLERRLDKDFSETASDNRTDLHQRIRIGAKYQHDKNWSAYLQLQYADTLFWSPAKNGSDGTLDTIQGYVQFTEGPRSLTIGRQKIGVGSERLIGPLEWLNRSRSFDAIRYKQGPWDAFVGSVGVQVNRPDNVRLGVVGYTSSLGLTNLYYKHQPVVGGDTDHVTIAQSFKKVFSGTELEGEFAFQTGHMAGKTQKAWAVHAQASRSFGKKTTLALEYDAASGGSDANTNRTFDQLYPTGHKFYGMLDMQGWKNMEQVALTAGFKCRPDMSVKLRAAHTWLRDPSDAWYGASGAANTFGSSTFKDATGASGRDLGWEYDLDSTWTVDKQTQVSLGIGYYKPGGFVQSLTGQSQSQLFAYAQYSFKL